MSNETRCPSGRTGSGPPDVIIVGAGPAGCATALAFSDSGARTMLLDSAPAASRRFAGEWLHPAGVRVLRRLGVDLDSVAHCRVAGFVIHPEDGSAPIRLPYPGGEWGMTCHHQSLVQALRSAVGKRDGITFVPRARMTGIERSRISYIGPDGRPVGCAPTRWLVGAEGRSSLTRRSLGLPAELTHVSRMAGMVLKDVELPDEDYGHILLGGPGPILLYRIGPRTVRVCIDVPNSGVPPRNAQEYLWRNYSPRLPPSLRGPLNGALQRGEISWAANKFRPRDHYGRDQVALVGDAVGCFHPLTAVGMTLALTDGETLAGATDLDAYRRERRAVTQVAEVLSIALYRAYTRDDPATTALRHALYEMLRGSARERARTMNLLATEDTRVRQFGGAFLHALALAVRGSPRPASQTERSVWSAEVMRGLGQWLSWLGAAVGHTAVQRVGHTIPAPRAGRIAAGYRDSSSADEIMSNRVDRATG